MARKSYSRRYAQAAFEIALEKKELDVFQADLKKVAAFTDDAGLVAVLESPKFPLDAKITVLSERLGKINPFVFNLTGLLISKLRFRLIKKIAEEYQLLLNIHHGIEEADVTTAVDLMESEKQKLTEWIMELTGKKVVLKTHVDPDLVAGIIARVGDKLIDGSIKNQLEILKREMEGAGA